MIGRNISELSGAFPHGISGKGGGPKRLLSERLRIDRTSMIRSNATLGWSEALSRRSRMPVICERVDMQLAQLESNLRACFDLMIEAMEKSIAVSVGGGLGAAGGIADCSVDPFFGIDFKRETEQIIGVYTKIYTGSVEPVDLEYQHDSSVKTVSLGSGLSVVVSSELYSPHPDDDPLEALISHYAAFIYQIKYKTLAFTKRFT